MDNMNGQLCKIVGSYRNKEARYPVYVYKTKETVLIKAINLKLVETESKNNSDDIKDKESSSVEGVYLLS